MRAGVPVTSLTVAVTGSGWVTSPAQLVSALSIADIRIALAELPEGRIPGPEDWNRLSQRLQRELHERIDDLNHALRALIGRDPPSKVIADRGRQPATTRSERPA